MEFLRMRFTSRQLMISMGFWLLAVVLCAASTARGEERLRWKLNKGQTLRYRATAQNTFMSEMVVGRPERTIERTTHEILLRVQDVDPSGVAEVERTQERLIFKRNRQNTEVSFDSKIDGNQGLDPRLAASFRARTGRPIRVKIDARGDVSLIEVSQGIRDELGRMSNVAVEREFADDALQAMILMQAAPIWFPEGPVESGKSWDRASKVHVAATKYIRTKSMAYTCEEIQHGIARIAAVSKVTMTPDGEPADLNSRPSHTGLIHFDMNAGVLRDSETRTVSITTRQYADRIPVTTTIESTSKTELISIDQNPAKHDGMK
jgi:Family of unknown function (DUF6263)